MWSFCGNFWVPIGETKSEAAKKWLKHVEIPGVLLFFFPGVYEFGIGSLVDETTKLVCTAYTVS